MSPPLAAHAILSGQLLPIPQEHRESPLGISYLSHHPLVEFVYKLVLSSSYTLGEILVACWKWNPEERPTFEKIYERLDSLG